jgi:ABC-type multidrug transport system fused ATPase/permease subunit
LEKNDKDYEEFSVVFKNVSLTYDDNIKENSKYALKNINLMIRKGEKIAICGRTGSGKSSILNILFRLYEIN